MSDCPSCGGVSSHGPLRPMCEPCADDVPSELVVEVAAGLHGAMSVSLIWEEHPGVYVEEDSLADFRAGSFTAHWWSLDETKDFLGEPWLTVSGGPCAARHAELVARAIVLAERGVTP